jgi:exonuclease SbcD
MKLLHTSDWHIGRALYGRKRYDEYAAFLDWLAGLVESEAVDVLLISGDVFDNSTPSNRAQELYYRFLCRAAASPGRHVVVIAGNHDSPSFLNAPKELLKFLNIHVVGYASEQPEDELLVLSKPDGAPMAVVCAVPYLRDRDIRTAEPGESVEDKERKIVDGIRSHYRLVCEEAERKRAALGNAVPIIAMGHLFAAGGLTVEGDGVRELYIGSLSQVKRDVFPECVDYVALGHLHIPQRVGGSDFIRYSGSPLPIGFGEAEQEKRVTLVEFFSERISPGLRDRRASQDEMPSWGIGDSPEQTSVDLGGKPHIRNVPVPRFQELKILRGDRQAVCRGIEELKDRKSTAWLEISYEGDEIAADLQERLKEAVAGTGIEILRVKNNRVLERALLGESGEETLDDLDATEVFTRRLDALQVPEDQRPGLFSAYREIIAALNDEDSQAA